MKTQNILSPNVYNANRHALKELKDSLPNREWMMCLGAGVSISAGLPNWYGLIALLTAQLIPIDITRIPPDTYDDMNDFHTSYMKDISDFYNINTFDNEFFKAVQNAFDGDYQKIFEGINVLEAAEYIRNFIKGITGDWHSNLEEANLEKQINWHMNALIQEVCKTSFSQDITSDKMKASTLGAVARLMKSENDSIIHNVITYNYDNLLETYLRKNCSCPPSAVHSIVKGDKLRDLNTSDEWNIYHVHGRIPIVDHPGEAMSETVILTETDYYKEEQINYSWTNIIQSYAIARANLIFIGFSGADYNFRRIIKYVEQEELAPRQRYIFFLVDDIVSAAFRNETDKVSSKDKNTVLSKCIDEMTDNTTSRYTYERIFINFMIHSQTMYWKDHGLKVIWSSREELAQDLESLH